MGACVEVQRVHNVFVRDGVGSRKVGLLAPAGRAYQHCFLWRIGADDWQDGFGVLLNLFPGS